VPLPGASIDAFHEQYTREVFHDKAMSRVGALLLFVALIFHAQQGTGESAGQVCIYYIAADEVV